MINLIWWKFDPQSAYEYDWLNALLSAFQINHLVDYDNQICVDHAIIVANLSQSFFTASGARQRYSEERQQFYTYVKRFKANRKKVGLFHLGDELYRESTHFYADLDFVFRQYYKAEDHQNYPHCYYLPIGYKSGFQNLITEQPIADRKYVWSFAGHLKGSRYAMMKHANAIPGGILHTTSQWNDPNALTTEQYADLLNNTQFSLCPMGNYSVDCFRVYESLEAGTIPIVEAKGMRQALVTLMNPSVLAKYGRYDRQFWLRNYHYWEHAFSSFPCPLIYNWGDLEAVIQSIDIEPISAKIQQWWQTYKQDFTQLMQTTVETAFS